MTKTRAGNPWAGLSSYQDPETSGSTLVFCGRKNESYDVAQLIDNNIFVTLYGKSGTGKTSLLNAGVFPLLRRERYLPVSIRLGMDARDISFQQCLILKINQALEGRGETLTREVVPLPEDEQSLEYLWSYFARTRFVDLSGQVLFPILVLDQFEEVFLERRLDAEALLRQIHFMMDEGHALSDRTVDGEPYSYDFNFRFVVSIREDDLYRLEDSIDSNYLPEMKHCRFRLRSLSEADARDVILTPGEGLFPETEKERITEAIIGMARNKDDHTVSTVILSLLCSRIYDDFAKTNAAYITFPIVEKFIKGNPFERFYNEATEGLTRREKSFIERNLVDSTGRRNSIPESDFYRYVKGGSVLFEGSRKILQRTSTSSGGGNYRVELIHDAFCEPLAALKEKRERRERTRWLFYALAVALVGAVIGIHFFRQNKLINEKSAALETALEQRQKHLKRIQADSLSLAQAKDSIIIEKEEAERVNRELRRSNKALQYSRDSTNMFKDSTNIYKAINAKLMEQRSKQEAAASKDPILPDGVYERDGIQYSTDDPSTSELKAWAEQYRDVCLEKVKTKVSEFENTETMLEDDPCLVYLILNSKSLATKKDKQEWFDLYHRMNEDQINQLYDILYREAYKLSGIEDQKQKKENEIHQKYHSLLTEYEERRALVKENPELYGKEYEELQDKVLAGYKGTSNYEVLLAEAYKEIKERYQNDPAVKERLIYLMGLQGELYYSQDKRLEAVALLERAYQMDPERNPTYLASAYNNLAYEYFEAGDFDRAISTVDKAISLRPSVANYYDSKGEFLYRKGDKEGALRLWRQVERLDPEFQPKRKSNLYDYLVKDGLL